MQIAVRFFVPNEVTKKRLLRREVIEVSNAAEALAYAYHTIKASPETMDDVVSVEIERLTPSVQFAGA